jgi:diguanylate cyclase (GGDEF)-like protein
MKHVNEVAGHGEGDVALKEVANVLRGALRKKDLAARLGDDEFALLLPGADTGVAQAVALRVLAGLVIGTTPERRVGASIGIVPDAQRFTTTEAVRAADTAMSASKSAGGSRITISEL